jgi:hypothetical protein
MHDAEPGSPDAQAAATMPFIVGSARSSCPESLRSQELGTVDDADVASQPVVALSADRAVHEDEGRYLGIGEEPVGPGW